MQVLLLEAGEDETEISGKNTIPYGTVLYHTDLTSSVTVPTYQFIWVSIVPIPYFFCQIFC